MTPYPLWALLQLYETSSTLLYINHLENFRLLVDWLAPIDIPQAPPGFKVLKLHHTYDIQEIAIILKTTQENIYYASHVQYQANRHSSKELIL